MNKNITKIKYIAYSAILCLCAVLYLFISPWSGISFTDTKSPEEAAAEGYVAGIITDDGTTLYFLTLQEAIGEVGDNETIILINDTSENITSSKSYTLEMNEHSINGGNSGRVYNISGGTVVLKNGTITNGNANQFGALNQIGGGINIANADVTLDKMTVTGNNASSNGGGIYFDGGTLAVTGSVISGNTATNSGGGIYAKKGTISVDNSTVSGNTASYQGGGIYSSDIALTKVDLKENKAKSGGSALYISRAAKATVEECTFDGNYGFDPSEIESSIIHAEDDLGSTGGVVEFKKCTVINNYDVEHTIYFSNGDWFDEKPINVTLTDCVISDNKAYRTGGIRLWDYCNIELDNTVVKNNIAFGTALSTTRPVVGGVSCNNSVDISLTFSSGAIYGNTANNGSADDLYIGTYATVGIIHANTMTDAAAVDPQFSNLVWYYPAKNKFIDDDVEITGRFALNEYGEDISLTAFNASAPPVQYDEIIYDSIRKAIEKAKAANEIPAHIRLVPATTKDGTEITVFSTEGVTVDHPIILDMGECSLNAKVNNVISVTGAGSLELCGKGTLNVPISVENDSVLTLATDTSGDLDIRLESKGAVVELSDDFVSCGKLSIELDADRANELITMNELPGDVRYTLINNVLNDSGDNKIELSDIEFTFEGKPLTSHYPLVEIAVENGNVVAKNPSVINYLYVRGKDSSDGNSGGYNDPFKTVAAALDWLEEHETGGTIYVLGTIEVDTGGDVTWGSNEYGEVIIKRYSPVDKQSMIAVKSGSLTLKNITIDGGCEGVKDPDCRSMITVSSKGTLVLEDGARLINNDLVGEIPASSGGFIGGKDNYSTYSGGAVYASGNGSKVVVKSGSEITDCTAMLGGAIYCENGTVEVKGGTFDGNTAKGMLSVSNANELGAHYSASGGAIAVTGKTCELILEDGTFTNNTAIYGGAIAIGTGNYSLTRKEKKQTRTLSLMSEEDEEDEDDWALKMTGGTLKDNSCTSNGGALFVQSTYQAKVHGGRFESNTCKGGGNYGGGAIYVNGGKNDFPDGELWLRYVKITDNHAKIYGGGIAGCGTSGTVINMDYGSVIYDNFAECYTGKYIPCDISSSTHAEIMTDFDGKKKQQTHDFFTQYMFDGTPYHWRFAVTRGKYKEGTFAPETYLYSDTGKLVYTTETPQSDDWEDMVQVTITDNYSGSCGGGIGTNGTIYIGAKYQSQEDFEYPDQFYVDKQWVAADISDVKTLNIWLLTLNNDDLQNKIHNQLIAPPGVWDGKPIPFFKVDTQNGEIPVILEEVIYKNGNHVWSVSEEYWGLYQGLIEDAVADVMEVNYGILDPAKYMWSFDDYTPFTSSFSTTQSNEDVTITNTQCYGDLTVSKTVTGNQGDTKKDFTFTVELSDISVDGTYGDMVFENGMATFTLKHNGRMTAEQLPAGISYTVTEAEADQDGYTTIATGDTGRISSTIIAKAEFVNTKQVDTVSVSVTKVWNDGDSANRPEYATVQLYCDGDGVPGEVVKLKGNYGTYVWDDLEAGHDWTVEEVDIPEGYTAKKTRPTDDSNDWTITNTKNVEEDPEPEPDPDPDPKPEPELIDVSVTKVWEDNNSPDRPKAVNVQLCQDGDPYGEAEELNAENGWTCVWKGLTAGYDWTVEEVDIPDGYTAKITKITDDGSDWVITNTKNTDQDKEPDKDQEPEPEPEPKPDTPLTPPPTSTPTPDEDHYSEPNDVQDQVHESEPGKEQVQAPESKLTSVSVKKKWEDNGIDRPKSITVQLYRNNKAYGAPVVLNEGNNWKYTWSNMEGAYNWTVEEKDVPEGYEATITHEGNSWTIINVKLKTENTHRTDEDHDKAAGYSPHTGVELISFGVIMLILSLIVVLSVKVFSKKEN